MNITEILYVNTNAFCYEEKIRHLVWTYDWDCRFFLLQIRYHNLMFSVMLFKEHVDKVKSVLTHWSFHYLLWRCWFLIYFWVSHWYFFFSKSFLKEYQFNMTLRPSNKILCIFWKIKTLLYTYCYNMINTYGYTPCRELLFLLPLNCVHFPKKRYSVNVNNELCYCVCSMVHRCIAIWHWK